MNAEALAKCRQSDLTKSPPETRLQCRTLLRSATTIRECNVGDDSIACDLALAGPYKYAPSNQDTIHDTKRRQLYKSDLKKTSLYFNE
jgi:hypothetical protein